MQWDMAFMPESEFTKRYDISEQEYDELTKGNA